MNNLIQSLTDEQLLSRLKSAASRECEATAHLIALLAEMDARKLYLAEGYASLFCLSHPMSESLRARGVWADRSGAGRGRFPIVLELLTDGSITLTTVCLLASHLNEDNHCELLDAARHRSKREVEQQVAALAPKPDVPSAIRRLPQPKAPVVQTAAALGDLNLADSGHRKADSTPLPSVAHVRQPLTVVTPLAPERYKVQLTIGRETHDKLRRVQDLLRHVVPNGNPSAIFDRALTLLLEDLERRRLSKVDGRDHPKRLTRTDVTCPRA